MVFNKTILALVAGVGLAVSATPSSADGPNTWSGFYVGGNVGWARATVDWSFPTAANSTKATSHDIDYSIAGVHFGVQKQYGSFLVGVEGALSGSIRQNPTESRCAFPTPFEDRCDTKSIGAVNTLGLRLGWVPSYQWMLYASGGFAQANVETAIRFGGVGVPPPPNAVPVTQSTQRHQGFYVGGGIDYALTKNWVAGLEYQHVFLGDEGHCVGGNCGVPSILNRTVSPDLDIVRFRLSYKFGAN